MKVLDRVEYLLRNDASLRDSDRKLLLEYWAAQGLHLSAQQEAAFMRCTTAETITRARRHLRDKYPGSKQAEAHRFNKFVDYRDTHAVSWLED